MRRPTRNGPTSLNWRRPRKPHCADLHNVLPTEWHEPFNLLFTRYETFKADIASWRRSSTALAKWAWSRCINRVDRYVRYKELSGRAKGNCFADHELHYHHLVEHFNGHKLSHLLAPYSTSPNDTCKWIGFDFDFHETEKKACKDPETIKARNLQAALRVYDALRKLGFRPLLVNSNGNGGYHVWVFFAEPIPSDLAYHFGRWMVRNWDRWGFQDQPEFFPKQPFLGLSKTGEPALGNVLRLPGRHHTREYWTMAWNGTAWVSGESAIQLVLKCVGDDPALIPPKIKVNAAAQAAQRAKRIARRTATAQRFDAAGGTFDGHDLTGISTDLIRDALAHLGPEYRDAYNRDENWGKMGWIEVGLALSSLGEEGLALWDEWSQNSPKYREDDCKERWATFKGDRQSPITVASIFHWAAKEGWQGVKDRQRELMKPYLDAIAIRAAEAQKPEDLTRFLDDLATLSRYDTDRWLELKAKLKASVFPRGGIADLAKRVSMRVEKMLEDEAKVVQDEEEADSIRPRIVADYGDPELSGQFVLAETYRYLRRQAATGKTVLYRRDTTLVRVVRTRVSTYGNKKMVMNAIDTVDAAKLMSILDGLADYGEVVKSGVRYGGVPERTCKAVLADSSLSDRIIPPLDYMITSPRFAPDGKLILKRGYHRSYATLHSPPPHLLKLIGRIATVPTGGEVSEAVKFIFEWVGDFPFVDDAGAPTSCRSCCCRSSA